MAQLILLRKRKEDRAKQVIHLPSTEGSSIQFGRDPSKVTHLMKIPHGETSNMMSRIHTQITCKGGEYVVEDMSLNGTFINKTRIELHVLQNDDELSYAEGGNVSPGGTVPDDSHHFVVYRFLKAPTAVSQEKGDHTASKRVRIQSPQKESPEVESPESKRRRLECDAPNPSEMSDPLIPNNPNVQKSEAVPQEDKESQQQAALSVYGVDEKPSQDLPCITSIDFNNIERVHEEKTSTRPENVQVEGIQTKEDMTLHQQDVSQSLGVVTAEQITTNERRLQANEELPKETSQGPPSCEFQLHFEPSTAVNTKPSPQSEERPPFAPRILSEQISIDIKTPFQSTEVSTSGKSTSILHEGNQQSPPSLPAPVIPGTQIFPHCYSQNNILVKSTQPFDDSSERLVSPGEVEMKAPPTVIHAPILIKTKQSPPLTSTQAGTVAYSEEARYAPTSPESADGIQSPQSTKAEDKIPEEEDCLPPPPVRTRWAARSCPSLSQLNQEEYEELISVTQLTQRASAEVLIGDEIGSPFRVKPKTQREDTPSLHPPNIESEVHPPTFMEESPALEEGPEGEADMKSEVDVIPVLLSPTLPIATTAKSATKRPRVTQDESKRKRQRKPPSVACRTAFQMFFNDQKMELQTKYKQRGERQPNSAVLRREINNKWELLDEATRSYYFELEEREREQLARTEPGYKDQMNPDIVKAKKIKEKKKAEPGEIEKAKNKRYRDHVAKLEAFHSKSEKQALQELRDAEAIHKDYFKSDAFDSSNDERDKKQIDKTRRISNIEQYLQKRRSDTVPLSQCILNPVREKSEPVEIIPTTMLTVLKKHQVEAIQFIWKHVVSDSSRFVELSQILNDSDEEVDPNKYTSMKGCIIAHSMGLGKTLTSIGFILMYFAFKRGKTVLVIAPKATLYTWKSEFMIWCKKFQMETPNLFLMDERRDNDSRLACAKAWSEEGGVMLIGYALFTRLVGKPEEKIPEPIAELKDGVRKGGKKKRTLNKKPASQVLCLRLSDADLDSQPRVQGNEGGTGVEDLLREYAKESCAHNSEEEEENKEALREVTDEETERIEAEHKEGKRRSNSPQRKMSLTDQFRYLMTEKSPDCLIVDEGHKLSNPRSCIVQQLQRVRTQQRILLTGTPIQNNLWEYFTMINLIRPGYWDRDEFRQLYVNRGSRKQQQKAIEDKSEQLYKELFKFSHLKDANTLKDDVPEMKEFLIYVALSPIQSQMYNDYVKQHSNDDPKGSSAILRIASISNKILSHTDMVRQYVLSRGLSEAVVIHDDDTTALVHQTGDYSWAKPVFQANYTPLSLKGNSKMELLFEIIEESLRMNEKVLVFSQYRSTLDSIERMLCNLPPPTPPDSLEEQFTAGADDDGSWRLGRDYFKFDAPDDVRQEWIEDFNKSTIESVSRLFLLTTKAGLGINLIGATRVVLFDYCWNPQVDQQAIHRAYRYGQSRQVFVYRLLTANTIDDELFRKTYSKLNLFKSTSPTESWTVNDFESLKHSSERCYTMSTKILHKDDLLRKIHAKKPKLMCSVESVPNVMNSNAEKK